VGPCATVHEARDTAAARPAAHRDSAAARAPAFRPPRTARR
jgi:hypothetical protein